MSVALENTRGGGGPIAQRLLAANGDPKALRPWVEDGKSYVVQNGVTVPVGNATLRKDEWKQMDDAVIEAATIRHSGVSDLYSRNLVYRIGNGLGTTVLEYEDMSDITAAELNMDAVTRATKDRPEYGINYLPLPIISKDFSYNVRQLQASRTLGRPLDTSTASLASFQVNDKIEEILFQGASSYTFGGGTIYGYVDQPNINSVTLAENWDASGKTGAEILQDVRDMKQASINAKHYGPWVMYVPTAYETVLDDDYVSGYPGTIRERILKISGITDVKVADKLAANKVLLVQMTSDVVRMVEGLPLTTVEWTNDGGMSFNWKVMTIQIPQIRADQNGNSGVTLLAA